MAPAVEGGGVGVAFAVEGGGVGVASVSSKCMRHISMRTCCFGDCMPVPCVSAEEGCHMENADRESQV